MPLPLWEKGWDEGAKVMNILLWIIQVLLALLFLFSGTTKFMMPVEEMNRQAPVVLPGL